MTLMELLPIIIYFLIIILLIICIVLGIRFIITLKKMENVIDDINDKIQTFNGLFNIIDTVTDKIASLSDGIVNFIINIFSKIINRKKKEDEIDE
jgi:uncharacterized protein YoxC